MTSFNFGGSYRPASELNNETEATQVYLLRNDVRPEAILLLLCVPARAKFRPALSKKKRKGEREINVSRQKPDPPVPECRCYIVPGGRTAKLLADAFFPARVRI